MPEAADDLRAEEAPPADCFVCAKHRGDLDVPGGFVWEDELVVATHRILIEPNGDTVEDVYLGHVLVEPRRHAPEHVYAAIVGDRVPHLHLHLLPRYSGTPREYWWDRVDEWPDAPRGDASAVDRLVGRLRRAADPPG